MKKLLTLFLLILLSFSGFAQKQRPQEEQLGIQYFQNAEYDKAAQMFEKVYNSNPNSYIYYYYYQTLLQLGDFKEAEKIVKKQQRLSPKTQRYKIDLGYVYETSGNKAAADKVYMDAIKDVPAQENSVKELYNAFLARKQYPYAVSTLERGRKLLNNDQLFTTELTKAYTEMGRTDLVVEEALNMVKNDDNSKLSNVQQILQNLLAGDEDDQRFQAAKNALLRRSSEAPDNSCYMNLLQWIYQQHRDYADALLIAKSIDRKYKGEGARVYDLACEAIASKDYPVAIEALNYLIAKGSESRFSTESRFMLLNVKYEQLSSTSPIDPTQAQVLESEFKQTLDEFGLTKSTSEWTRKYAHLLAFYVNKPEQAIELLNQAITNSARDPKEKGQYKIDLADIYLYQGNVWDATLLYSQVDKDLPNDLIGQTAKFKNAKLSFYIGEFAWAKSQLDVLRAATSKFIANDAMYFSFIISDNEAEDEETDEDSDEGLFASDAKSNMPLRYYAKADFLMFQNKDDDALQMLDSILILDPYGKLADDVYYQKAKIFLKKKDYLGAEQLLNKVITDYTYELLGDDATFLMAQLYDYNLKDSNKAMEYYQKILTVYPDSLYTIDARKRYRELRGDFH